MIKLTNKQWRKARQDLPKNLIEEIEVNNYLDKLARSYKGEVIDVIVYTYSHIPTVKGEKLNSCFAITPKITVSKSTGKVSKERGYVITHIGSGYALISVGSRKEALGVWEVVKDLEGCNCYTYDEFDGVNTRALREATYALKGDLIGVIYERLINKSLPKVEHKDNSIFTCTRKIIIRKREEQKVSSKDSFSIFNSSTE